MTLAQAERTSILTQEMLETFRVRAAGYDRDNTFFTEDFDDLRRIGYLDLALPTQYGGAGFTLSQVGQLQERLAQYAPATALALNMHHYWVGTAADMQRMGDNSMEFVLRDAADGHVFAAGHGERGNDMPLYLSTTRAERVEGGYRFYGHKMFGSLSPVWTRMGIHAMDATDPRGPHIVHAFIDRQADGFTIKKTWDTLGMRATQSEDTLLEGVFAPDSQIAKVIPAGTPDLLALAIGAWGVSGFARVYVGIARRAIELAVQDVHKKSSLALTRSMAYHPEVQHLVADMQLELESISALVDRVQDDWSNGVDHGDWWSVKIAAAKHQAAEGAKRIVDAAMTVSGGAGMFRGNELERLYRDVRAGGFHPYNPLLTREIVGKITLGIDPGEQPRWG